MFVEWRIIGKGTSCSAMHTIRTRYNMNLNSAIQIGFVLLLHCLFSCGCLLVFLPFPSSFGSMLCVVFEIHHCGCICVGQLVWRRHGGLPLPSIMCSAPHACNFYLLWRCIASGSWKKTAATFGLLCFGSTPN